MRMLVLFGSLLTGLSGSAQAADYASAFGFGISVPDVYLVLSRAEVEKNAATFLAPDGSPSDRFHAVAPNMRRDVFDRIRSGQLEIFYRQEGIEGAFVDNVNVMLQPAALPSSSEQLGVLCRLLPREFSRVFGRPIGMDKCELRRTAGRPALYIQFEGAIPGTTTLQYQVERRVGETIVITATAARANLPRMMGEFEEMVGSIRLH